MSDQQLQRIESELTGLRTDFAELNKNVATSNAVMTVQVANLRSIALSDRQLLRGKDAKPGIVDDVRDLKRADKARKRLVWLVITAATALIVKDLWPW